MDLFQPDSQPKFVSDNGQIKWIHKTGRDPLQSGVSSFIEHSFQAIPTKIENSYRTQVALPSVGSPGHELDPHASVHLITPGTIHNQAWVGLRHLSSARRAPYLPTPPSSPYTPTPGQDFGHMRSYSSRSMPRMAESSGSLFTTPSAQIGSVFEAKLVGSSLLQAIDPSQSPDLFVRSVNEGTDPFIDQSSIIPPHQRPPTAPIISSVSLYNPFKPSRALLDLPRWVAPELAYMAQRVGIDLDGNYKGDITKEHIYNAVAPDHDNCALHIIGLPADVKLKEVFSVLEGKVFSFQLHDPVPGKWAGCGARLVFTNRLATEQFYWKSRTGLGISIRGHQIRVLWNRDHCRPQHYADRYQSRVLQIKGPATEDFTAEAIENLFRSKLLFELVERNEWLVPGGMKVIELHFPSILGQSRPAMKQFYELLDEKNQRHAYMIQYAPDPCDSMVRGTIPFDGRRF